MTIQAANIMPAVPNYNGGQNVAKDSGCDFESFLSGSKASVAKTEHFEKNPAKEVQKTQTDETSSESLSVTEKTVSTEVTSDKKTETTETTENVSDEMESAESVTREEGEQEELLILSEQLFAEILSVLQEMVVVLQEELQVTEQQLLGAMEELQFQVTDFFDTDKIKAVFLQMNNVDVAALLTDESLYADLQQLQNLLDDIVGQSDLYSLLKQEGIVPEEFEFSMLETKITEQILNQPAIEADVVADVNIEFESVKGRLQDMMEQTDVTEADSLQTTGIETEEEYAGASDQENAFDAEQKFNQASMFLQKLAGVTKSSAAENVQSVAGSFDLIDIATQIIDQVRLQVRPDTTRMQIQLNPEHLGKVELEITSKNGELSAKMNVQNDQVKEAVESQMQVLRETLEVQGIKVESIEVTVAEFGFRFQDETGNEQPQQQRQNRQNRLNLDDIEEDNFNLPDVSEVMMELNGNSVDYVA